MNLLSDDEFLRVYIDTLSEELPLDLIIKTLCDRWGYGGIYQVAKKRLVESRKKKSRNALSRTNRRTILSLLDRGTCQYCVSDVEYFEVDHIKPIEDLGTDDLDNVVVACHGCNRDKSDRPREEMKAVVLDRRKEKLWEVAQEAFKSQKGRSAFKQFLTGGFGEPDDDGD